MGRAHLRSSDRSSAATSTTTGTTGEATPGVAEPSTRDGLLDAIRALAIVRVFLWHAFGAPWLSYVVASMPAMFFVSGALLETSAQRRGTLATVADRLRRLALPLWAFASVALVAITVGSTGSGQADLSFAERLWWFVPLRDPPAAAWEGGWLSSPLWYLRAFVWFLLAAPLLRLAARRAPRLAIGVLAGGLAGLEWVSRHPSWPLASPQSAGWPLADFCLYGIFVIAGMRFARQRGMGDGTAGPTASFGAGADGPERLALGVLAATGAAGWALTQPVPNGVANDSHIELLFVGAAWLWLFLAGQDILRGLAASRWGGPVVTWLGRRAMTVYLWHAAALGLTYRALVHLDTTLPRFTTAPVVIAAGAAVTTLFVLCFGWVEDCANRRQPAWWPRVDLGSRSQPGNRNQPNDRRLSAARLPGAIALTATLTVAVAVGVVSVRSPASRGAGAASAVLGTAAAGPSSEVVAGTGSASRSSSASSSPSLSPSSAPSSARAGDGGAASRSTGVIRPPTPSQRPKAHGWEAAPTAAGAATGTAGTDSARRAPGGEQSAAVRDAIAAATNRSAPTVVAATTRAVDGTAEAALPGAAPGEATLVALLEAWRAEWEVQGVIAGVERPGGLRWLAASGHEATGAPMAVSDRFVTYSITKSFVGALAMQLVSEGLLHLDEPLPALAAAPGFPYGDTITLRMLLNHTAGLVDYHEIAAFSERDPALSPPSAAEIIAAAGDLPLTVSPGAGASYSGTNYLLVGLLIEQVLGYPLADELQTRLFGPLDLHDSALGHAVAGSEGGAAGGVYSSLPDLVDWTAALLRDTRFVDAAALAEMTAIDPSTDFGLALWGFCPCTIDEQGGYHYASIGHVGATEIFRYFPETQTTVVFHLSESIWEREGVESSLAALLDALANPQADSSAPAPSDASDVEAEGGVEGGDGGFDGVAADDAAGADG